MLELDQRRLFLEALKPPPGFTFDRGIGTTFTLDLTALLITPLSLALLDHGEDAEALADPLLLLESLRKFSNRLTIFCQAGRISIPKKYNHLYHYLENQVVEVQAPLGGVFHPKVWLLRYVSEDHSILFRLLVMTRNLTFDKSWDLMVQLDGNLSDRQLGYSRNNPLGDFIKSLPDLAINPVAEEIQAAVDLLQDEVRRVNFRTPPHFKNEYQFHPLGIPGYQKGFLLDRYYYQVLVVSPFLEDQTLQQIASKGNHNILISETESLDALKPETLQKYTEVFNLDNSIWDNEVEEDIAEEKLAPPSGLHAKLFVFHHGWESTWLVGSANATRPALRGFKNRNVEFMLELTGKKSRVGIEQVLGDAENDTSIRNLLRTYQQPEATEASDPDALESERLADKVRQWLVNSRCVIELTPEDHGETFQAVLKTTEAQDPPAGNYAIHCWPVSLAETHAKVFDPEKSSVDFPSLSILAITPFMAFRIRAQVGDTRHTNQFVLQLPVQGLPAGREDHLIGAVISDQAQFLRFLRLILSQDPSELWRDPNWIESAVHGTDDRSSAEVDLPLLEELLRAFSRSPEKIDRIDLIVKRMLATPEGRSVLPEGFEILWSQFVQAKEGNL